MIQSVKQFLFVQYKLILKVITQNECAKIDDNIKTQMSNYRRHNSSNTGSKGSNFKQQEVSFLLVGDERCGISIPYVLLVDQVKKIIKLHDGLWSPESKMWEIPLAQYSSCFIKIDNFFQNYDSIQVKVVKLADFVVKAQKEIGEVLQIKNSKYSAAKVLRYQSLELSIDPQSMIFYNKLYDFQKISLQFGIKKHGRLLLADEMGVGKTIQSLAIASIYRHEWPLLIICPSSLRLNWQQQILNWMGDIVNKSQVQVITKSGQNIRQNNKITIISYDLAWKNKDMLDNYKVAIADEAHYLKNEQAKRSEFLVPYLSSRKRVILLTGTPALAKPKEIFNLISIVRPDVFVNFNEFGYRYCEPQRNPWSRGIEFNGCKNTKELHYILKDKIMIRRMKKDVLTQLPDKLRQKIIVQTDKNIVKEIKQLMMTCGSSADQSIMNMFAAFGHSKDELGVEFEDTRQAMTKAYTLTGLAKLQAIKDYVSDILSNNQKILIFGHHKTVLDGLEEMLVKSKIGFVRIDGDVSNQKRHQNVKNFQERQNIKVALLSITAAGVGLTLTASSTVVFAQLHWTPGMMVQAEDRAHRIGQKNCVNCHYLIGENTLDEMLYRYLSKKIYNVSSFVDGKSQNLQMEQMGKKEKTSRTKPLGQNQLSIKNSLLSRLNSLRPSIEKAFNEKTQFTEISDSDIDDIGEESIQSKKKIIDFHDELSEESEQRMIKSPISTANNYRSRMMISQKSDENIDSGDRKNTDLCEFIADNCQQIVSYTHTLSQIDD